MPPRVWSRHPRWKKPNKFGNIRTVQDGITFDSRKEAARYRTLKALLSTGQIADLQVHPRFPLIVNQTLVCVYIADFSYIDMRNGKSVVEDVKSPITAKLSAYRIKKKLMEALHNITIREV